MAQGRFGGPERVEHSVREPPGSAPAATKKPTRACQMDARQNHKHKIKEHNFFLKISKNKKDIRVRA